MDERNLDYEQKFRVYMFKGDFDRFKVICENLNVKPKVNEGF